MLPQFLTPKLLTIFLNVSQVLWWVPSALCQPLAVPERTWSPPWSFWWEPRGVVETGIDCWKRPDNIFCRQTLYAYRYWEVFISLSSGTNYKQNSRKTTKVSQNQRPKISCFLEQTRFYHRRQLTHSEAESHASHASHGQAGGQVRVMDFFASGNGKLVFPMMGDGFKNN